MLQVNRDLGAKIFMVVNVVNLVTGGILCEIVFSITFLKKWGLKSLHLFIHGFRFWLTFYNVLNFRVLDFHNLRAIVK